MARPAPAATRAIEVLNFLAARPLEFFTLSEIGRNLGINAASTHALLAALSDAGYLMRHPVHKTYRLGLAAVGLGAAAAESNPVVSVTRAELHRLHDELGVHMVASARIGDEILVLERAGRYLGDDPVPPTGQRLELAPPRGAVFLAWSTPAEIERWIATAPMDWARNDVGYLRSLLERTRVEGYAVVHANLPTEGALVEISNIAAPIFGPDGRVVVALSAHGFTSAMSSDEIETIGETLRKTALGITNETHGRMP